MQLDRELEIWPVHCNHILAKMEQHLSSHSTMKMISPSNFFDPTQRSRRVDSQLMDKMVAEILCDVFMPRLPYACSRRRCRGHGSHVSHTIIQQAEECDNQWGERLFVLILTSRQNQLLILLPWIYRANCAIQPHLWAFMLLCIIAFDSTADCWLGGCAPTPPFTPIEFPPENKVRISIHIT